MTDRPPPAVDDGERETLFAFLGYLRQSALGKADGVPDGGSELATRIRHEPSNG